MSETSEFICDVVEIGEISPHPNADRLELVAIKGTSYTVVAAKGEWKSGDRAVHIGPDSMVPLDRPEFAFLKTRLDVKPGQSHYRLRMAKLRGIASHGILVPVPVGVVHRTNVGDSFALELDVSKYETPAERLLRQAELEVISNQSLFQRILSRINPFSRLSARQSSKRKASVPDYSVVNLRKVPGYFAEGELVEITEKIHGANIRFGLINGRKYIASHHSVKTDMRSWWERWLHIGRAPGPGWYKTDIWTEWCAANVDFNELPDNTVFYGEIYGKGVQDMEYGLTTRMVVIFDVWFVDEKRWAEENEKYLLLATTGFKSSPAVRRFVNWDNSLLSEADGDSRIPGAKHIREGVVVKSVDGKKRAKIVSDAYKMRK
jgi:hypothetical protein